MWLNREKLDLHVKRSWEEFGTQASGRRMDRAARALLRLPTSVRSGGLSVVGLLVPIRASNDDLETASVSTKVGGRSRLDARSPKGAFEVGNASWAGTAVGRVQGRITLDVKIEPSAQRGVVAPLGAP